MSLHQEIISNTYRQGMGNQAARELAFQVPGVPAVVQHQPNVPPAVGVSLRTNAPTSHVPDVGAADE